MNLRQQMLRMLLVGAGTRLVTSFLIIAALWAGFFWATTG